MRIRATKSFSPRTCPGCAMPCSSNENRCPICGYEFPQPRVSPLWLGAITTALILILLALWISLSGGSPPQPPPPLPDPARRVVSLAPSLTEIVFAIGAGDRLVGRTDVCDYPQEARSIPVIGGFGRPSMERILIAAPDLVLDMGMEDKALRQAIKRAGIAWATIPCRTLDEIPAAIREVGQWLGKLDAAAQLSGRMEIELAQRRARPPRPNAPRVYAEIWPDPPMTAGRRSFLSEMIALAGAQAVGNAADREYFAVSSETVLVWNPDVLLVLYDADPDTIRKRLAARPGWASLPAVVGNRILIPPDLDILLRPGPRLLQGVEWLEEALRQPGAKIAEEEDLR